MSQDGEPWSAPLLDFAQPVHFRLHRHVLSRFLSPEPRNLDTGYFQLLLPEQRVGIATQFDLAHLSQWQGLSARRTFNDGAEGTAIEMPPEDPEGDEEGPTDKGLVLNLTGNKKHPGRALDQAGILTAATMVALLHYIGTIDVHKAGPSFYVVLSPPLPSSLRQWGFYAIAVAQLVILVLMACPNLRVCWWAATLYLCIVPMLILHAMFFCIEKASDMWVPGLLVFQWIGVHCIDAWKCPQTVYINP